MDKVIFTRDELERLTIKNLRKLIEYYEIPFSGRLKEEYIQALLDYYTPPPDVEQEQQMSVRVRRIKESMQ